MPVHDWTRVTAGIFHAFHLAWIAELQRALNSGFLPPAYYALAEQVARDTIPDVLTLQQLGGADRELRRQLVIRHLTGDRVVALVEILSPGNKQTRATLDAFVDKAA